MKNLLKATLLSAIMVVGLSVSVFAGHEGLYEIGEEKLITSDANICFSEDAATQVLNAIGVSMAAAGILWTDNGCSQGKFQFVTVVGQLGEDVIATNGLESRYCEVKI